MGQAMERRYKLTGDPRYLVNPNVAILPIDASDSVGAPAQ